MKEDYIRLIFGLKVKQIRSGKELSLFKLGKLTGLSKSYLNEIEKGKKYPKTDKILAIAEALEVTYDELVSLKLDKNLAPVAEILQSDILKEIPLEMFGIEEGKLIDIIANAPAKVNAFISTLIEIGNNYNLTRERFYLAALRSFQEANDNYFPEIEKAAKDFTKSYLLKKDSKIEEEWLSDILIDEFDYKIVKMDFHELEQEELNQLRSIFIPGKKVLYINHNTDNDQRKFILAKELGYNYLGYEERVNTFSWAKFENFDELMNNFYASYFAGALLLPEDELVEDLNKLISLESHKFLHYTRVFSKYTESPETIYQRMTNILPKHFNIRDLFFLRLIHKKGTEKYGLTKELHLNQHQSPQANETYEHYCRRWVSVRILQELEQNPDKTHLMDAQVSIYPYNAYQSYYVLSSATTDPFNSEYLRSVSIGLKMDYAKKKIKFLNDDANLITKEVAVTCENCGLQDCEVRAVPSTRFDKNLNNKNLNFAIDQFVKKQKEI